MSHSREQDLSASDESAQHAYYDRAGYIKCGGECNDACCRRDFVLDVASHVGAWIAQIVLAWLVEDGRLCRCPTWHGKTVHICDVIVTGEA